MTTPDNPSQPAPPPTLARSAAIVALFGLAGPLAGALALNALLTLFAAADEIARGDFAALPRQIVGGMIAGSIFSVILGYAVGTVSALGVGIMLALHDRRTRGISLRVAVLAALGFWLVSAVVVLLAVPPEGRLVWISALLAAHLAGALVCGWIARRLLG
jgi:hypothetical protein